MYCEINAKVLFKILIPEMHTKAINSVTNMHICTYVILILLYAL